MRSTTIATLVVILCVLAAALYISLTNPGLHYAFCPIFFFVFFAIVFYLAAYQFRILPGNDEFFLMGLAMFMNNKEVKEKALGIWQDYKRHMGEPEFEMLPGERILIPLTPSYFRYCTFGGVYRGLIVTNMRILIGFSRSAGGRYEGFGTGQSFGKKNNLWHSDAPEIPERIGKADFTYSVAFFANPRRLVSDWNSRIEKIEYGNDELGNFVKVSFTGGNRKTTFYTPDAKRIVEIFSNPIAK